MDPQRWRTVRAVFDELVELEPERRAARLAVLRISDPQLCEAVESLLAADAASSGGLGGAGLPARGDQEGLPPDPLGLAGRTLSHFRVQEPLEAGGMGVVYRAEDTRLGRAVALKFLLPHHVLDPSAKQRFLQEAWTAGALDHPNLCTIYEVGESEDGRLFLAMPLYPGETLKARLERDGALPVAEALAIARQIAQGLACAHAAGIVHRDLKPGNVMLLPDGTVKILDFGVAKVRDLELTRSGGRLGTVSYMAPEQVRGETVDARADLWALGVVLYEMLTGRRPFLGEHETAIAHAIVNAEPDPPSALRPELPPAVEELVLTALRRDPASRHAGAPQLLEELLAIPHADGTAPHRGWRSLRRRTRTATARWMVLGESEQAHHVLQEASDRFEVRRRGLPWRPEDHVTSARIRIVAGDREGAIQALQVAVQSGWRQYNADPYDPVLGSLHGDPRYDRLMAEVRADVDRMRARVEREGW
jgi:serine/threonine protein kinase